MTVYQVCADDDDRMPTGNAVLSTHPSAEQAWAAVAAERAAFRASAYYTGTEYLRRIVVEVGDDGSERTLPAADV